MLPQRFVVHSLEFVFVRRNDYCAASYLDLEPNPVDLLGRSCVGIHASALGDPASSMIKPYWVDPIQILKASRLNRFQRKWVRNGTKIRVPKYF